MTAKAPQYVVEVFQLIKRQVCEDAQAAKAFVKEHQKDAPPGCIYVHRLYKQSKESK